MSRIIKRFLIPLILLIIIIVYFMFVPEEYTDLNGAISVVVVLLVLPAFCITLVWAILRTISEHRLKAQGIAPAEPSASAIKEALKRDREETAALPEDLRKRKRNMRLLGILIGILGMVIIIKELVFLGTLVLIAGGTLLIMSSPETYSSSVDGINMLVCPKEYTLDRIYNDFKEYKTIYGSVYRGTTFPKCPALFWKGADEDAIVYVYKPKGKDMLYIGAAADIGTEKTSEPLYPAEPHQCTDFEDALCFNLEYRSFVEDLTTVFKRYLKDGTILPMPDYRKGNVYFFEEYFKLTGQRFTLYNAAKEPVYTIEGTYPLKTLRVFDEKEQEIFRVTKEVVNVMPHYLFYENGELMGEFTKNIDLLHDTFTLQTREGQLEMQENNLLLGDNYRVTMNGERIGSIAERLNLTFENIVFDNLVLTVYEDKYLPLMTALAIMAVREMVRDKETDNN